MTNIITAIYLLTLAQIETGNNPYAIGAKKEVTAFQISVLEIKAYPELSKNPANMKLARSVATTIWNSRIHKFIYANRHIPNTRQLYLLWNCPADVLKPSKAELERAKRFENLFNRFNKEKIQP